MHSSAISIERIGYENGRSDEAEDQVVDVLGDSQESEPIMTDEEVETGTASDESEKSQPSFDQPSEVFQAASEDPVQTHSVFSAPANSQEAGFSLLEFSSS